MTERDEEKKKQRITVGLDDFDHKVITKMSLNRNLSLSEVVRTVVHQWIEYNPDLLKKNYNIDFKEITDELRQESYEISIDKTLKSFEKDIIKELPEFFELVENISILDLAEHFDVDKKVIKRLIFTHGKEIRKLSLNLTLKNDVIYKILT